MDNLDLIETNDSEQILLDYREIYSTKKKKFYMLINLIITVYFDILSHQQVNAIVLDWLVMNMYCYLYLDDEYVDELVEVVLVCYDNDDEFVLQKKQYSEET